MYRFCGYIFVVPIRDPKQDFLNRWVIWNSYSYNIFIYFFNLTIIYKGIIITPVPNAVRYNLNIAYSVNSEVFDFVFSATDNTIINPNQIKS